MHSLLRVSAALVGVSLPVGGVLLALFISGVEPSRPISPVFVSALGCIGLVLGIGLFAFALLPRRKLAHSSVLRLSCITALVLPLVTAGYLFIAAPAWITKVISILLIGICLACMSSLRNLEARNA